MMNLGLHPLPGVRPDARGNIPMADLGREPLVDEVAREMHGAVLTFMGDNRGNWPLAKVKSLGASVEKGWREGIQRFQGTLNDSGDNQAQGQNGTQNRTRNGGGGGDRGAAVPTVPRAGAGPARRNGEAAERALSTAAPPASDANARATRK